MGLAKGAVYQDILFQGDDKEKKRRIQGGVATTDVTVSAHVAGNAEVFPQILGLHVPPGAIIADVTYGSGVFWRNVPKSKYTLKASDIATGVDCRALPYEDGSLDCVVLDPPYMEGFFRRADGHKAGSGTHSAFRNYYSMVFIKCQDARRAQRFRSRAISSSKGNGSARNIKQFASLAHEGQFPSDNAIPSPAGCASVR